MKDDLISKTAAIDALDRLEYTPGEWATSGLTMCKDAIKELPSAQQWISCRERLPLFGQVLAQTNGGSIHEVFYKGKNDYDHDVWMRLDGVMYWDAEIVAWMPLPTPYREEGQDG